MNKEIAKTGTTTMVIVCKDGIVLAADHRVTAGYIANKRTRKIQIVSEDMAVTTAGVVSDIQLMAKLIRAETKLKNLQTYRAATVKEVANLSAGLLYNNIRKMSMIPGIASFLLGGRDADGFHAYSLEPDGAVLEIDDYNADGSGMMFATGVLEAQYKKGLSVEEGVSLAEKAIRAAIERDPSSGNGYDVVTITVKGLQFVIERDLELKAV